MLKPSCKCNSPSVFYSWWASDVLAMPSMEQEQVKKTMLFAVVHGISSTPTPLLANKGIALT